MRQKQRTFAVLICNATLQEPRQPNTELPNAKGRRHTANIIIIINSNNIINNNNNDNKEDLSPYSNRQMPGSPRPLHLLPRGAGAELDRGGGLRSLCLLARNPFFGPLDERESRGKNIREEKAFMSRLKLYA